MLFPPLRRTTDWRSFIRGGIAAQIYEISLHADDERLAEHLPITLMETGFADCIYCGGQVQECTGTREVRWKGELFLVEGVPMGVCNQCGERFLKPDVAKTIDKLLQTRKASWTALIPVLTYTSDAA